MSLTPQVAIRCLCPFASRNQIHRLKHVQFGQGFMSDHLDCHIFFPNLPIKHRGETYLSHEEQELWFDQVIIPIVQSVMTTDVLQHWPRSWSEALNKAKVVDELQIGGQHSPIKYQVTIPPHLIQEFWQAICERISRARRNTPIHVFREAFLLVSGHNLKIQYRSSVRMDVQRQFLEDLEFLFDMEELVEQDCWIDLGTEPAPERGSGEVYLLKSHCLQEWQREFANYDESKGILGQHFNWFLTRDGSSARVVMSKKHQLQQQGLAYVKYYNLHKDIFAGCIHSTSMRRSTSDAPLNAVSW